MNTYDIAICSFLFICFFVLSIFYIKSEEFKENNFIINILYFVLFGVLFLGSCSAALTAKYSFIELQEEKNINNYVFENISKNDLFFANTIKENTNVCINKNILKFLTNSNSQKITNVIEAKNAKKKITKENYAEIYQPCLTEYLKTSFSNEDYNTKFEILKKSNLME